MQFLLCAILMYFSTICSAQNECLNPEFQKIVPLENLLGRWYAIAESDNFPEIKNGGECPMYHKKRVEGNKVSAYVLFFNSENRTQLHVRLDYKMMFDSGSPTEGKFGLHFLTNGFEEEDGLPCHVITLVPEEYYVYYCCHIIKDFGPRYVVQFLSADKFPHPDLFETMKKAAKDHGLPVNNLRRINQEGCIN